MSPSPFYKIEVYAPEDSVDDLLGALAQAHAGEIGHYDYCASILPVQGCWRPLEGAKPLLGNIGELFTGEEMKIEMLCREEYLHEAIHAIREAHPYEEPVINIIPLANTRYNGTV